MDAPVEDRSRFPGSRRTVDAMSKDPFTPPLRTQSDVERFWRTIIHPLGWARRRLYFVIVGPDDRPLPCVNEVDDIPAALENEASERVGSLLRDLLDGLEPEGRIALLVCRPGDSRATSDDRALASAFYAALRAHRVPTEVIHLANDVEIEPVPMDAAEALSA